MANERLFCEDTERYPEYLVFAKTLAMNAQEIALRYFGLDVQSTWKYDHTPLTRADTEINDMVIRCVNETYPEHSIHGEERSDTRNDSRYIWVCDPVDGTMPFSNGLPLFTFSLALVDQYDGQPVLGVINDPVMRALYWAVRGAGAYRNDKKIHVNNTHDLLETYLSTDGSGALVGFSNLPLIGTLSEMNCKVMKFLSFTYGGVQVANGKFIGAVFYNPYAHDVAALKIITEEAGGRATDLYGNDRRYDQDGAGCILSNGHVHEKLVAIVSQGRMESTSANFVYTTYQNK